MKFYKTLLFLLICFLSKNILAQNSNLSKIYTLQFDYGLSRTLHYKPPVNIVLCFDGCFPEEQKGRLASNFNANIYRNFNQKNSLKLGFGLSQYRFLEKGLASPGDNSLLPYEDIRELNYLNLSVGLRHIITQKEQIHFFAEIDLIYERLRSGYYLSKRNGIAIKPQIGIITKLSDRWNVVVTGFYKTGIIKYNKEQYNIKSYIPLGYGLQIGFNIEI